MQPCMCAHSKNIDQSGLGNRIPLGGFRSFIFLGTGERKLGEVSRLTLWWQAWENSELRREIFHLRDTSRWELNCCLEVFINDPNSWIKRNMCNNILNMYKHAHMHQQMLIWTLIITATSFTGLDNKPSMFLTLIYKLLMIGSLYSLPAKLLHVYSNKMRMMNNSRDGKAYRYGDSGQVKILLITRGPVHE